MENQETNNQELQKNNSRQLSLSTSKLTVQATVSSIAKIKSIFPSLSEGYFDILCERIKANNFSDKEFALSVDYVIDTFTGFGNPRIGDFIKFIVNEDRQPHPLPELTPEEKAEQARQKEIEDDEWRAKRQKQIEDWYDKDVAEEAAQKKYEADQNIDWFEVMEAKDREWARRVAKLKGKKAKD